MHNQHHDPPTRIVEILGPAGAGKSTLTRALVESSANIEDEVPPDYRKLKNLPFFLTYSLLLIPTFSRILFSNENRNGRFPLTAQEMIWMVILTGWHKRLKRRIRKNNKVILLDQGPIFMLAYLNFFGSPILKSQVAKKWMDLTKRHWADGLDLVIGLDSSNQVLVERARNRTVWHGNKERTDSEAYEFLDKYRDYFDQIIKDISVQSSKLRIKHYDTNKLSEGELVNVVSQDLEMMQE
jgi:thymidylate kinase